MQKYEAPKSSDSQPLNQEEQQAVFKLALRLQQEKENGATLQELVAMGKEAGLSAESVEEAYRLIKNQPVKDAGLARDERARRRDVTALWITVVWVVFTWLMTWIDAPNGFSAMIGAVTALLIVPSILGALPSRVWLASSLGAAVSLNLILSHLARFGPSSTLHGGLWTVLLVPFLLAAIVSLCINWTRMVLNRGPQQRSVDEND